MSIVSGDQAYTALLAGWTVNGQITGSPGFMTYSFSDVSPQYLLDLEGTRGVETFVSASAQFRVTVREAMDKIEAATNFKFFEVPSGQGEMGISLYNLYKWGPAPQAIAFAYQVASSLAARSIVGPAADIVFDVNIGAQPSTASGTILHEVGHVLGLKHSNEGDITLAPELDNIAHTVMTLGGSGLTTQLGSLDIQALQKLYGVKDQGVMQGDSGNNVLNGGASADFIKAGAGHDMVYGGDNADMLFGGDGNDHLFGAAASTGPDGNDTILAGDGSDYIQGNAGKDFLAGEGGSDRINGGADNDTIYGGEGNDTVNGNKGDDLVYGQEGNDSLRGGQGNDSIDGGAGNDAIGGDLGSDTLSGGAGMDTFIFADQGSVTTAPDQVRDFVHGQDHVSLGFTVSAVLTGASQASISDARTLAQQLFNGHAGDHEVAALGVGSDTYLFYAGNGGNTIDSAINLIGINPSVITVVDFA